MVGGKRREGAGYFVEPTVMVKTNPDMKVVREEIFGPVVCAMPFRDVDKLVAEANQSEYGLAAGGLDARHRQGAPDRAQAARRHGVDQLLQRLRRGTCPSADTSSPAGAARWATKRWSSTPK